MEKSFCSWKSIFDRSFMNHHGRNERVYWIAIRRSAAGWGAVSFLLFARKKSEKTFFFDFCVGIFVLCLSLCHTAVDCNWFNGLAHEERVPMIDNRLRCYTNLIHSDRNVKRRLIMMMWSIQLDSIEFKCYKNYSNRYNDANMYIIDEI